MEHKKETILEWYRKKNNDIDAPCGGRGECGRCKIRFLSDAPFANEQERRQLSAEELEQGIRLACMTEKTDRENFVLVGDIFSEEMIVSTLESEYAKMQRSQEFGVAVDIGTTTLAMRLVGLQTETHYVTLTALNRQRAYGADVITRIQAANQGMLEKLQMCVQQDIFAMLFRLVTDAGIDPTQLKKITIAGNTTMCHLLLGYSCDGLGRVPFEPVNIGITKMTSSDLFEAIGKSDEEKAFLTLLSAEVTILPGISAFVGADIVSGMYYCDMDLKDEPHMLLDVGTNGEMVIGSKNGFVVTSTAAGPVFEGGNISCGMPAVKGAITHIKDGTCECIGDVQPQGICGSALVDLAACLLEKHVIDENGTLCETYFDAGYPIEKLIKKHLPNMTLTQSDIRELQMGKAAIRAGIELLLQIYKPENIYLAGGFGAAMNIESACKINLFPKEVAGQMTSVGNASLEGAQKFLLDPHGEERVIAITVNAREIILAKEGKFEENYILFMQFLV